MKTLRLCALVALLSSSASANTLPRNAQLDALKIRNANAGQVAEQSIKYFDSKCGRLSDAQVREYLSSDYQNILVALNSLITPLSFEQLHAESLRYSTCVNTQRSLDYLKKHLGMQ